MAQEILQPERTVSKSIDQITFNIQSRTAIVRVTTTDDGKTNSNKVVIPFIDFLNDEGYTAAQITGIKDMFKKLMAKAYGIVIDDLTDEAFPEPVEAEEPTM